MKIAIALCVVLFSAVAHSVSNDSFVNNKAVQREAKFSIHSAEDYIKGAYGRVEQSITDVLRDSFRAADDFSKRIISHQTETLAQLMKLYYDVDRFVAECQEISKPLWMGGAQATLMSDANKCIIEHLKSGYSMMVRATEVYTAGLANITKIKAELGKCSEEDDAVDIFANVDTFLSSEFCPQTVAAKTLEVSVIVVPALRITETQIKNWWQITRPKIDICTSSDPLLELRRPTDDIFEATRKCFEANIELSKRQNAGTRKEE